MDAEQQFQTAVRLFQGGDMAGAENALAPLLRALPRHPEVLHLAGVVRLQAGRTEDAIDSLKALAAQRPDSASVLDLLGCALRQGGRLQAAARTLEKALALAPGNPTILYNLGNAYRDQRDFTRAADHYAQAVRAGTDNLNCHFNLGQALYHLGRFEESAATFVKVTTARPDDAEAQVALASALLELNDRKGALSALRSATATAPTDREANCLLSDMLRDAGDLTGAIACLERASDAHPDDPEILYRLAALEERDNNLEAARRAAEAGLARTPGHAGLALVSARLDRHDADFKAGLARLNAIDMRALGNSRLVSEIHFELGFLHQNLDRPGEAIDHITRGNAALVTDVRAFDAMKARARAYLDGMRAAVQGLAAPSDDAVPASAADPGVPVFLIGFPCSGSAFLNRILGAHPGIQVLDEQQTLSEVRNHLLRRGGAFPADLFAIPENQIEDLRRIYFAAVDRCTARRPGVLLVDMMPLNILDAGLIHRLFPTAKFLLALRHPCDVCLSCFMQPFDLNEAMAHFTRLEDTVGFYEDVMTLWQDMRAVLPLDVHTVRYEEFASGPQPAARNLLEFLGLPWHDEVLEPAGNASGQTVTGTPGDHRVSENIQTAAVDSWRKYEIHMLPHLRRLKPFIDAFGYSS